MNKRIGVCEWSLPLKGEELYAWLEKNEVGNLSIDFDYESCRDEKTGIQWCEEKKSLAEKHGVQYSILAINTLCTYGMNQKTHEDLVKDIILKGVQAAKMVGAPAVHLPSFGQGEIKSREELEQVISILNYACRVGEELKIEIGYECPLGEEELGYVLEHVSGETFYMLFDNENVSLRGIDPVRLYEKYKNWYKHTHLKTCMEEKFLQPMEDEKSFGGIGKVIEAMNENGFCGWIISESDYWKNADNWETIFRKDMVFMTEKFAH